MPTWTPEVWNEFRVGGLVVVMAAVFYWSLITERLVIGKTHRREIDSRDRTISLLETRSTKDAESIFTLSSTVTEGTAREDAIAHMMAAFREALERQ
ncbi:MAG: hypothetical protein WBB07_17690 [Mycobacterium sp.]